MMQHRYLPFSASHWIGVALIIATFSHVVRTRPMNISQLSLLDARQSGGSKGAEGNASSENASHLKPKTIASVKPRISFDHHFEVNFAQAREATRRTALETIKREMAAKLAHHPQVGHFHVTSMRDHKVGNAINGFKFSGTAHDARGVPLAAPTELHLRPDMLVAANWIRATSGALH
ncbi:hypothetical protein IE81DRAFT_142744 [Ceraceosorus guamensis]|uniref:Uncharacterized protein n=1 Tax=Ceraceosorus guamensis TaxID=1522189 RepID=A0A316VXS1_9BASI|nr:hypothetical protein IE81DRAFT_142744 [Ceraceosorus guamensis]PWN42114.1 hypothetical protein IE81DRAFT_142744 [Ceraceosorus guamensis]